MAHRTVGYYQTYYRETRPENAVLFALQEVRRRKTGSDTSRNLAVAVCRNAGLSEYICQSVGDIAHDIAANRRRLERQVDVPKTPPPPSVHYSDVMIDLECEGLESVTAFWDSREDNGWSYSGGRYRIKLKQPDRSEWDMWISPDQMRTIQANIEEATDGDPPRAELHDWIDTHWNTVKEILDDEGDWHDEEWCCCTAQELEECWEDWNLVVESEDSPDPFPHEYACTLGFPEGVTYGEAYRYITSQLRAAGNKVESWQENLETEDDDDEEDEAESDPAKTLA